MFLYKRMKFTSVKVSNEYESPADVPRELRIRALLYYL